MRPEAKKFLYDIQQAAAKLIHFSAGKDYSDYAADPLLRSAVERQFEIIGEALRCLAKEDPATASRIADYRQVVAFRNILIHGYAQVDDGIVWDILTSKLPPLIKDVESLLQEA
jgi:uncharacterized protein with HEPN domain